MKNAEGRRLYARLLTMSAVMACEGNKEPLERAATVLLQTYGAPLTVSVCEEHAPFVSVEKGIKFPRDGEAVLSYAATLIVLVPPTST
jgi:hypothetical protein